MATSSEPESGEVQSSKPTEIASSIEIAGSQESAPLAHIAAEETVAEETVAQETVAQEKTAEETAAKEIPVVASASRAKRSSDRPVAVITGAARRVGREIALAMAERGLAVVIHHGTSNVEASVLVNRIRSQGGTAVAVAADLRDPRAAAMTVFDAAADLGEVTTLINSAAVFQERALPWVDLYHCNVHFSVNVLAPIFMSQQFTRQLGEGHRGHIINILDWRAQRPGADHFVYTASKAALVSVTKSLALQLAPLIQVNGVAPGAILPPEDKTNWHEQRAITSIPLQRTGSPKELVDAINFLLNSDFITGEVLTVSGGEEL